MSLSDLFDAWRSWEIRGRREPISMPPTVESGPPAATAAASADAPSPQVARLLRKLPTRDVGAFGSLKRSPDGPPPPPPAYVALHARADPPPHRVVKTEKKNILLRQFEQIAEAKRERQKRARAGEAAAGEERAASRKAPRRAAADEQG